MKVIETGAGTLLPYLPLDEYGSVTSPRTSIIDFFNPSASGNAGVGNIDSKIEQAMDLVKSHLMYAVREEIDVLRAKIGELERKVHRLETENTLLRECVSEDVLAQLAMQQQQQQQQHNQQHHELASPTSQGSNNTASLTITINNRE